MPQPTGSNPDQRYQVAADAAGEYSVSCGSEVLYAASDPVAVYGPDSRGEVAR